MGNIGDAFTTSLPAVGAAGPGFATDINAILTEVMSRLSSRIPFSSLLLNQDLDLNGQGVVDAAYLTLVDGTLGASPANRFTQMSGNAYWVGPAGAVQITDGTGLALSSTGAITGDYGGSNPAQFRFVDADQRYNAYDDFAGGAWAYLRARGFDVAAGATSAVRSRITFGGAGNLDFILPATNPAGVSLLTISSAGQLAHNASIAVAPVLAAGIHVKHGDFYTSKGLVPGDCSAAVGSVSAVTLGAGALVAVSSTVVIPLQIPDTTERIKSVVVYLSTAPASNVTYSLQSANANSVTRTGLVGSTFISSGATTVTLTPTTPFTGATGSTLWLEVVTGGATTAALAGYSIVYDAT